MTFKNMKIPVENNLDEILETLESHGYELTHMPLTNENPYFCFAFDEGTFLFSFIEMYDFDLTTLAELKEM